MTGGYKSPVPTLHLHPAPATRNLFQAPRALRVLSKSTWHLHSPSSPHSHWHLTALPPLHHHTQQSTSPPSYMQALTSTWGFQHPLPGPSHPFPALPSFPRDKHPTPTSALHSHWHLTAFPSLHHPTQQLTAPPSCMQALTAS